jgi:hypothetical protein
VFCNLCKYETAIQHFLPEFFSPAGSWRNFAVSFIFDGIFWQDFMIYQQIRQLPCTDQFLPGEG